MTSAVVRLKVLDKPSVTVNDEEMLFRVIRASFAQRRKTLLNGLSSAFSNKLPKEQLGNCLAACGLPVGVRGEKLTLDEFAQLSDAIGALI